MLDMRDFRYSAGDINRYMYFEPLMKLRDRTHSANSLEYINFTFMWYILVLLMQV